MQKIKQKYYQTQNSKCIKVVKVETLRTDKTGKVISQKLEPGTYTLKETKAPQGYKLLKEEIEVVVEANKVVQVQVENAKELGSLQVIKKMRRAEKF